ncbi:MAG: N-acetyltransferase [Cyanobacteria bacterium P01_D01_bin.156]
MHIRVATHRDQDNIHNVHWSAFPESEREVVAKLAINLLLEKTTPSVISLVAESEDNVVGHMAFSPVTLDSSDSKGYILAPLAVKPEYQKRRIGSQLIETGMEQLSIVDVDILFVYGDPNYYGRFGFNADAAESYIPPYKLEYPFGWQAIILSERSIKQPLTQIACVQSLSDPALW